MNARSWPVLLVLGALLAGSGCWQLTQHGSPRAAATASPNWGDPDQRMPVEPAAKAVPPAGVTAGPVPSASTLSLTRLGVRAAIVPVVVSGGVMSVPQDPRTLGWWADGARPGATTGSAVIVGHVNYAGVAGALGRLPQSRPGDEVVLTEHQLRLHYRITAVRSYPKSSGIPSEVFSRTGTPRLVLITCGGSFDPGTGNYLDNVVAYATPTS